MSNLNSSNLNSSNLKEEVANAKNIALKYLAYRLCTTGKMREFLVRKGVKKQIIEPLIEYLLQKKLLDDSRLAEDYVESILDRKPQSKQALSQKMRQLGFSKQSISESLAEYESDRFIDAYFKKIRPTIFQKITTNQDNDWSWDLANKECQRLIRHALNRGFSFDEVNHRFGKMVKEIKYELE